MRAPLSRIRGAGSRDCAWSRTMTSMTNTTVVERDLAIRMFEVMALTRAVEDRMVTMYRQGELLRSLYTGHWHEAISGGTASALRPTDVLAPPHPDLRAHLWRRPGRPRGPGGGSGEEDP